MYAKDAASILGAFTGTNFDAVNTLNQEFDKQKAEIVSLKEELKQLNRKHENKYDERQEKNVAICEEMQREKIVNATLVRKVALLERQCEDANASAASSLFSKFSQEEFKEISIQTNKEHHDLVYDLFKTLENIFESHMVFDKMSIVLEDLVEKRQQDSKAYDKVID